MEEVRPSIAIAFPESFDRTHVRDFADVVGAGGSVGEHVVPDGMQYRSGIEWLAPTLVVLFVAKAYFEGMVQAAGSDHYALLKRAASRLLSAASKMRPMKITHAGAAKPTGPYSPAISIVFSSDTESFKLLFDYSASETEIGVAISTFLNFAEIRSRGESVDHIAVLRPAVYPGAPRLLTMASDGRLLEIDPLEGRI